ncbi:MAG: TrkH family potassium uptake protein [Acidobacteriota bacterium]|nr:TrkH family potassium uptake protein [Acidobacteriota bacterium]
MNIPAIGRVLGLLILSIGFFMAFPAVFAWHYGGNDLASILISSALSLAGGALMFLVFRPKRELRLRDSFAVVVLGWILASAIGALPFYLSGAMPSFTDAFFESMSGFTTTGATVLLRVEDMPHGLLFWRSLTHWLGGMGIIILSLAILPMMGTGGMQLYRAEVTGPMPDKITPRIKETAMALWGIYVLLTILEAVLLMAAGLNLFDSLCHTFGSMATGGFSTRTASIGGFDSLLVELIVIAFMFIAGINFALHHRGLRGRPSTYWKSEEFRFYCGILIVFSVILAADNLITGAYKAGEALRVSIFQTVSITTTTGFATADFGRWSTSAQLILLLLMFVGGCAGSTGGSIKVIRIMILFKQGMVEIRKLLHPRAVIPVRVDGRAVPAGIVINILGFMLLYMGLVIAATFALTLMGLDLISAFSAVASSIGNIGPGLGAVGPASNFQHVPLAGKWILSFCMLAGRLEIYTVLVLFTRDFWKR